MNVKALKWSFHKQNEYCGTHLLLFQFGFSLIVGDVAYERFYFFKIFPRKSTLHRGGIYKNILNIPQLRH